MYWPDFLMLVSQIPIMQAREQLGRMDAGVYGNRVHADKKSQIHFDVMRGQVQSAAYPKDR